MIDVKNVSKKYGKHRGLYKVDFHIPKGHIVGLLGHNGAGKSTTLNILTGYLFPDSGQVFVDGVNLSDEPLKGRSKVGYLPEKPPLYLDMTVKEYLKFVCELNGIKGKKAKDELQRIAKLTEIEAVVGRRIGNLSKGYKQRVGVAQALVGDKEILIFDEPTVGLDPGQIMGMRKLITNLSVDKTVIISSHILSEISKLCDSVIMLSQGELIAYETMDVLLKDSVDLGALTVKVEVDETKIEDILSELSTLEGVNQAQANREAGNIYKVEIQCGRAKDMRRILIHFFQDKPYELLELESRKLGLEDIFMKKQDHAFRAKIGEPI